MRCEWSGKSKPQPPPFPLKQHVPHKGGGGDGILSRSRCCAMRRTAQSDNKNVFLKIGTTSLTGPATGGGACNVDDDDALEKVVAWSGNNGKKKSW